MKMNYNPLHNFISPVTGRFCIPEDYILVGNSEGIGEYSPLLKDMRLKMNCLQLGIDRLSSLENLQENKIWIGNAKSKPEERDRISVGHLPKLGSAKFPVPDVPLFPDIAKNIPIPNPTFNPLNPLSWVMGGAWLSEVYTGSPSILGKALPSEFDTAISSSLAMTQINVAQALKRIDHGSFIVKSRTLDFNWENPLLRDPTSGMSDTVRSLYGLLTRYSFKEAQALDELDSGQLLRVSSDGTGTLESATLEKGQVWQGDDDGKLKAVELAPADVKYIIQEPHEVLPNAQSLSELVVEDDQINGKRILKCNDAGVISYANGGTREIQDDFVTPSNLSIARDEIKEQTEEVVSKAKAELEGQIAALVEEIADIVGTAAAVEGFLTVTDIIREGGLKAAIYTLAHDTIRLKSNKDVTGVAPRYDVEFDSNHWGNLASYKPGIKLVSMDSSILLHNDLLPVSIGLFSQQSPLGVETFQEGFVWQSYFENSDDNPNIPYRTPTNFGLYYVTTTKSIAGWRTEEKLYDYDRAKQAFIYYKHLVIPHGENNRPEGASTGQIRVNTDADKIEAYNGTEWITWSDDKGVIDIFGTANQINITTGNSPTISLPDNIQVPKNIEVNNGNLTIPVGTTEERPENAKIGMIRINTDL